MSQQITGVRRATPFWQSINAFVALVILVIVGALIFFIFQPELFQLEEMKKNYEAIEMQKKQAELEQLRLAREKGLIKNDPTYFENIARDKLDLMKPGETIFRLENRSSSNESGKKP